VNSKHVLATDFVNVGPLISNFNPLAGGVGPECFCIGKRIGKPMAPK